MAKLTVPDIFPSNHRIASRQPVIRVILLQERRDGSARGRRQPRVLPNDRMPAVPDIVTFDQVFGPPHHVRSKTQICAKDAGPAMVYYLHSGVCIGYDLLADGRRQIIAVYLPGDLINAGALYRGRNGQNVVVMIDSMISSASPADLKAMSDTDPMLRDLIVGEIARRYAMLEIWTTTLGRKSALERMATFFCEISSRLRQVDGPDDRVCLVPLNQVDLADILGLSVVHVNRVLKTMRDNNLASFEAGRLEIRDFARMASIAEFEEDYLL